MKYTIHSTVKDQKPSNSKMIRAAINTFEGKRIIITIEKATKKRSNQQNRWYWGVAMPLIQEGLKNLGHEFNPEQAHDLMKYRFLKEDLPVGSDGEFITRIKSTTELTTTLFMDFKAEVQKWSAEFLGINIPDPNEQVEMEME